MRTGETLGRGVNVGCCVPPSESLQTRHMLRACHTGRLRGCHISGARILLQSSTPPGRSVIIVRQANGLAYHGQGSSPSQSDYRMAALLLSMLFINIII